MKDNIQTKLVGRVTGFWYLHLYSAFWDMLFWLKYVRKTYSHTYVAGKGGHISEPSQIIVDVFLWFHSKQSWPSDSLKLVAIWNLKPYKWFFSTYLHCIPLICLVVWMDLLPIHDFIASCISHLENTGSLDYVDLPNVDIFLYTILFK